MQNILVPTDFSLEAHHAFEVALQLAQRTKGQITLLHVLDAPSGSTLTSTGGGLGVSSRHGVFMVHLLQRTKRQMHELMLEVARKGWDVPVLDRIATGDDVDEAILEVVREQHIDLVVVGAHKHTPSTHLFGPDSHAERLVRLAPCPVLTVKHPAPHFEVRSIFFASDFSDEAHRAVSSLRQICAAFPEAKLHLLDVVTRANDYSAAMDRIHAFAYRHNLNDYVADVVNAPQISEGIPRYTEQAHADLVVMLTHGRTGIFHLLQGSIAESVAVQASTPVLTFHPETY